MKLNSNFEIVGSENFVNDEPVPEDLTREQYFIHLIVSYMSTVFYSPEE